MQKSTSLCPSAEAALDVRYLADVFPAAEADQWFDRLQHEIDWRAETFVMFGRPVTPRRLTAWYGDPDAVYAYSGLVHKPRPWTPDLSALKAVADRLCARRFNSVLLNLYPDGDAAMGWHSDDEPELGPAPVIVSFSFGAARRFWFKSRPPLAPAKHTLLLEHGSALVMGASTQARWRHALMRDKEVRSVRINLTFRHVGAEAPREKHNA